jgi:outer membrane protein assembly factor BamB
MTDLPGRWTLLLFVSALLLPPQSPGQQDVLTYHNDNSRTGQNLHETVLTPANVKPATFGKLYVVAMDGKVDAQPLYVSRLDIPGKGQHDVVFAATEHDSIYAFDASNGSVFWKTSALKPDETPSDKQNCSQVMPEIGITATPVIDRQSGPHGAIYVVAMSKDARGAYHQRLHALDLTTGAELFKGPKEITARFPGTGDDSHNGSVLFDPKQHEDRAGLVLLKGVVYTSWSSHCDYRPYTGFVIGYDEHTLAQAGVFDFAPNGNEAAIWNSGAAPAADESGNLYFSVANGSFDTTLNARGFPIKGDYGNAFVRLTPSGAPNTRTLHVSDYWSMYNTVAESDRDEDLGSGGLVLLPQMPDQSGTVRHLGVGAGKDEHVYVFDSSHMGKFNPKDNSNLYQDIPGALHGPEFGELAWFNGAVYVGAVNDNLRAFRVTAGKLSRQADSMSKNLFPYPGSNPVFSANGTANAIVWAYDNGVPVQRRPAVLRAYDPSDLTHEYYDSNQAPNGRDQLGTGNKFISPTVGGGRVFVGTTYTVVAFGLLTPH